MVSKSSKFACMIKTMAFIIGCIGKHLGQSGTVFLYLLASISESCLFHAKKVLELGKKNSI